MKILLTGASGFVGTNFILELHNKYDIVALVRESSDISKIEKYCKVYRYDGNIESLMNLFKKEKFDGVVHLAAFQRLDDDNAKDFIDSMIYTNITFGSHILEASKKYYIKFFINTLSSFQYANSNIYSPMNLLAATKHAFYKIIYLYSTSNPILFCHLLLYDNYGENDKRVKIFNLWKEIAKSGENLDMSPGEQKMDIIHVRDVVSGFDTLIELCNKKEAINGQIYTLESKRHTLKELARLFEKYTDSKLNITWGAKPYRKNEIMNPISSHDNKDIMKLPNFNQKISLKEGLKSFVSRNDMTNNWGGVALKNDFITYIYYLHKKVA